MATMNEGQRKAFTEVIHFLNDPNRKMHRLSGGAGTGKSWFISKVVDDLLKHKNPGIPIHSLGITATTNKAAAVLADAIPHRKTEIRTIYSYMNLRVSENFSTGEVKCVPTRNWEVHNGTFIIVDEASMVNKELMKYLEQGTTSSCKILFVGDKNQLNPVKEEISPVYSRPMTESTLSEPVRNSGQQALMDLCNQAVETVKTGIFTPIQEVPGVIDFVDGPQLKGLLEREYCQEDPTKRLLCYTNKRVVEYNSFIRELRGYGSSFAPGEMLVNNTSVELIGKDRLYTDQLVEVVSVSPQKIRGDIVTGHDIPTLELRLKDPTTLAFYEVEIFADPEDRDNVIKYYSGLKKWDRYFKIKNNFPDLRSVASSTTHKAQGSTYESVIVDLADIGKSTNKAQTARLQYVALSRPKQRLYIRGQLPPRYFE
jgi:hypothetical protein